MHNGGIPPTPTGRSFAKGGEVPGEYVETLFVDAIPIIHFNKGELKCRRS